MVTNPDRPNALLNPRLRKYLLGELDIEPKSNDERAIRQAIRRRLINGLLDCWLISRELEERDRDLVFDRFDHDYIADADEEDLPEGKMIHRNAVAELVAFLYRGSSGRQPGAEAIFEDGIARGQHESGDLGFPNYEVTIEIEEVEPVEIDLGAAIDRLESAELDELSEEEMRGLLRLILESPSFDEAPLREEYERRAALLLEEYEEVVAEEGSVGVDQLVAATSPERGADSE